MPSVPFNASHPNNVLQLLKEDLGLFGRIFPDFFLFFAPTLRDFGYYEVEMVQVKNCDRPGWRPRTSSSMLDEVGPPRGFSGEPVQRQCNAEFVSV
jgi:hypothetical protein